MRYIICITVFLISAGYCNAQEILSTQTEARFITRFPFTQFSGGVIVIRASIDNYADSLNFILDTGSGGISLDSSTCSEFGIHTVQTDTTITGIAGIRKVHFAFNKSLVLPGLKVDNLNFHINDYEILTNVYGEKIDGIIGYSFFSRYIIKINYDSLQIEVFSPGKITYPPKGTLLHPIFTALPIQLLQIKDKRKLPFNFYFDTGAGLCILLSERFVKDSAILLKRRKPRIAQAEGMGGMLKMRLTVIKEAKLGPYRFRRVPVYLYQDDNNITSYPFTGGLLGSEILRRFNLVFNYPQREIHLLPNSHYDDQFDYAYTGLSIYSIDQKILVVDVIKNSPAEKAGFEVEDEIIAVDNNFSGQIQQYKNILQMPHQKIKIIVKRGKDLLDLTIRTKSIL